MRIPKALERKVKKLAFRTEEDNKVIFAVISKLGGKYELLCSCYGKQKGIDQFKDKLEDIDLSYINKDTHIILNSLIFTEKENEYINNAIDKAIEGNL